MQVLHILYGSISSVHSFFSGLVWDNVLIIMEMWNPNKQGRVCLYECAWHGDGEKEIVLHSWAKNFYYVVTVEELD